MDLRNLKYFVAVAQEKSIGLAAIRLNISQPPLTRQIQQLEDEMGAELFIRSAKGVALTQAGEILLQEALNILLLVDQATERTQSAGRGKLGRIDIGVFGSGIHVVPRLLLRFRNAYPDVNMVVHTLTRSEQIEALRQRRLTIGFHRMLEPLSDISYELIARERLVVAINKNDPLACRKSISLHDTANHPMVFYPTSARNFIDKLLGLCRSAGFTPKVSQEVDDLVTAIALVAGGFGLCVVPESAMSLHIPDVIYLPLNNVPEAVVDLSCIYRSDDQSPILKAFLDVIKDGLNNQPADPNSSLLVA
uniref:Putative LysR-type regulatory protein n=1 Tax=Alcaligenes sp. NyZ215 TaxID=441452 RepID=A7KS58_9BURK|nr:putative LysR-type regulatory protein [Alcaligenes sp. NyZ215]